MSSNLTQLIQETIAITISQAHLQTTFGKPLTGFAKADDPLFGQISADHLQPKDILPSAQTVIAYFLPFRGNLVEINRQHAYVAKEWAIAYIETNQLIANIGNALQEKLAQLGMEAKWEQATHNFDPVKLRSAWSHKSVAYIAGLGTFGHHTMLITPSGCAGRFGSLLIDRYIPPTPRPDEEFKHCSFLVKGTCGYCFRNCPSGALTSQGLDRQRCYSYVLEVDQHYDDLSLCDVCGKCATGPCGVLDK